MPFFFRNFASRKSTDMATEEDITLNLNNAANYDENSIVHLEDMEHIRLRPGMYIGKLGDGSSHDDGIYVLLKEIVDNYPKSTVSELAGLYVKGIKEGRLLASGKMNNGSIWERRFALGDLDSLAMDTTFTKEKNCNWMFIVAYEHDSINQNQLLYEVAQYNFSNFSVRNFDIDIEAGQGIDLLKVSPFLNYDEAYIYLHKLNNTPEMVKRFEGLHLFIISEDNLKKIMRGLSFADYFDFYDENFDRTGNLKVDDSVLDEPTEILDPDDLYDAQEHQDEEEEFDDEENFIF